MHVLCSVLLLPSLAWAVSPRTPLAQEQITVAEGDVALVVKWHDHLQARVTSGGDVEFADVVDRTPLDELLTSWDATLEPLIQLPEWKLRSLEARAESRSGRAQPDLAGMHRVWVDDATEARLTALGKALQQLPQVEFVTTDHGMVEPPGDLDPVTPDLSGQQGYLGPDPGIDAEYAWSEWGLTGTGIHVRDCEYGWDVEHEDLVDRSITIEEGQIWPSWVVDNGWHHHGTAVAGELVGQDNGYGVTGITPDADFSVYPEWSVSGGGRRVTAVTNAIADSAAGDVVLLEMQANGPDGAFAPAEVNQALWTVVRAGVDAGVVVIGAAGNGAADLDSADYEEYRSRGDSGAIIVGAGSNDTGHDRLGFSTYGARVDVQGWGTGVFTTGYGSYAEYGGDSRQAYTATFNGTSSASPIVTGAAVLLIEASLIYRDEPIAPDDLRSLLVSTGIPAGSGVIGPFPDLEAALLQLETDLDVPPSIDEVLPETVNEGDPVDFVVTGSVLPIHEARFSWALPDGTELGTGPTLQVPTFDDGVVEVDVTITDEWDRTATERVSVPVLNVPPVATAPTTTGDTVEGSTVLFSTTWTDASAEDTVTIEWSVDGEVVDGTTESIEYRFSDDGAYDVTAIAVDDDGGRSVPQTTTVTVDNVVPTFTIELTRPAERGVEAVLFATVTDPGDDTAQISWDLGDGTFADGMSIEHTWRQRGLVTVTATLTDEDGSRVVETLQVDVDRRPCGCTTGTAPTAGWLGLVALVALRRRKR